MATQMEHRAPFCRAMTPPRLEALPSSTNATSIYQHWEFVLNRYITSVDADESGKLCLLANSVSYQNYSIIHGCQTFDDAFLKLKAAFVKPHNTVVARYKVITAKQSPSSSVDDFFNELRVKCSDCDFKAVSADEYQAEYMRDAFISGLSSSAIRTRLLENRTLSLDEALSQARALELAMKDSSLYMDRSTAALSSEMLKDHEADVDKVCPAFNSSSKLATPNRGSTSACYFCGREQHARDKCPARFSKCRSCKSKGHWSVVCRKTSRSAAAPSDPFHDLPGDRAFLPENCASLRPRSVIASSTTAGQRSLVDVSIGGHTVEDVLIDSGSGENFISCSLAQRLDLPTSSYNSSILLAQTTESVSITRAWTGSLKLEGRIYPKVTLLLMNNPCNDIILGTPFLERHSKVELNYGGDGPPLKICAFACMTISPPKPFQNLSPNCSPVATRSR